MKNGANSGVKMHGSDHTPAHFDLEAVLMLLAFTNVPFHRHHHRQAILQSTDYPKDHWLTSVPLTLTNFFRLHCKNSGHFGLIMAHGFLNIIVKLLHVLFINSIFC